MMASHRGVEWSFNVKMQLNVTIFYKRTMQLHNPSDSSRLFPEESVVLRLVIAMETSRWQQILSTMFLSLMGKKQNKSKLLLT